MANKKLLLQKLDILRNKKRNTLEKTNYIQSEFLYKLLQDYFVYLDTKQPQLEKGIIELDEIINIMITGVLQRYRNSLSIFYFKYFDKENKEDFFSSIRVAVYNKLSNIYKTTKTNKLHKKTVFSYFTVMIKNFIMWEYYKILKDYSNQRNFQENLSNIVPETSWLSVIEENKLPLILKINLLYVIQEEVSDSILRKKWDTNKKEFYNAILLVLHYSIINLIDYDWFEENIIIRKYNIFSEKKQNSITKNLINIRKYADKLSKGKQTLTEHKKNRKFLLKNYVIIMRKLKLIKTNLKIDVETVADSFDDFILEVEKKYYHKILDIIIDDDKYFHTIKINDDIIKRENYYKK